MAVVLLNGLPLEDTPVSVDAGLLQRSVVKTIEEKGAYIGQLKGNHGLVYDLASEWVQSPGVDERSPDHIQTAKGNGCVERECLQRAVGQETNRPGKGTSMSEIRIVTITPAHFRQLEALQRICYPTLGTQELMTAVHFAAQFDIFPEGQFVALAGDRVVGQGSGFFVDFDFEHPRHTFSEICAGFTFANHDPGGDYYYGADISVHPNYRGRGIGRLLYRARKNLVRRHNKRGIVAGGLLPGYAQFRETMSPQVYVDKVVAGELVDSTLTFQLKNGFRVRGLVENYIEDSASGNWSTLIEWVNPEYRLPGDCV